MHRLQYVTTQGSLVLAVVGATRGSSDYSPGLAVVLLHLAHVLHDLPRIGVLCLTPLHQIAAHRLLLMRQICSHVWICVWVCGCVWVCVGECVGVRGTSHRTLLSDNIENTSCHANVNTNPDSTPLFHTRYS